jgi:hypothetical protein
MKITSVYYYDPKSPEDARYHWAQSEFGILDALKMLEEHHPLPENYALRMGEAPLEDVIEVYEDPSTTS